MKIAVFGLGYVGMVTASCLARDGHEVVGVDVNPRKVDQVRDGRPTVSEPGLDAIVAEAVRAGRLHATGDAAAAVAASELALVCVGTPSRANGSLDTQFVEKVCTEIGDALRTNEHDYTVVVRSTVLPGTTLECLRPLLTERSGRTIGDDAATPRLGLAVNPEFLREGSAIEDYFEPSVIVVGADDRRSGDVVERMYADVEAPLVRVSITTGEMVKYVNNAFHALKITFANEVGALSRANGVDGRQVMEIVTMDTKLNVSKAYLRPGYAFGGSCLPKDMRALLHRANELDVDVPMLSAVLESNGRHVTRAVRAVEATERRKVGVLGLSFKPGTDDVRESPSVPLIETLIGRGYEVLVYDEAVVPERLFGANREYVERELPHIASIMRPSLQEVLDAVDVVVIANGSGAFRKVHHALRADQVLVDLVGAVAADDEARPRPPTYASICW